MSPGCKSFKILVNLRLLILFLNSLKVKNNQKAQKYALQFSINDSNLDQLLDFDDEIIIKNKKFNKLLFKTKIRK